MFYFQYFVVFFLNLISFSQFGLLSCLSYCRIYKCFTYTVCQKHICKMKNSNDARHSCYVMQSININMSPTSEIIHQNMFDFNICTSLIDRSYFFKIYLTYILQLYYVKLQNNFIIYCHLMQNFIMMVICFFSFLQPTGKCANRSWQSGGYVYLYGELLTGCVAIGGFLGFSLKIISMI